MKFRLKMVLSLIVVIMTFTLATEAQAQDKKKKKKKKGKTEAAAPKEKSDFDKLVEKCDKNEGLFTLYRDTTDGSSYMEISEDQLDKEFIYFSYVANGLVETGNFRGGYRGSKIIKFRKNYENIEIITENTRYYFDKENAISRASGANINEPILASLSIKHTIDSTGVYVVNADEIFKSEDFQMVKGPTRKGRPPSMLGKLSSSKTHITDIRNFPENTDVIVDYVYDNPNPQTRGSGATTDPRFITVKYQHSLIEMPDNDFEPRRDDPRIGYFMTSVNDMTSFSPTPYRDMIHRWNLVKKNPDAAISDPVEPIVYWIENTTPEEFRPIIKAAGERWNQAFEKAGFSNAVLVKIQPDTAEWEAGDIRYNVLRWTSSPNPPFGGYGPSFVNPRTGQILGADIMLEYAVVGRRLWRKETFERAGLSQFELDEYDAEDPMHDHQFCAAGEVMHHNLMFGLTALEMTDTSNIAQEKFVQETLYRLILHEIGHTLGLTHNMHASTMLTFEEIQDPAIVAEKGLCNSVMEYPAVNYAATPELATRYYDENPGPYDLWVIEYGYSPSVKDAKKEEGRLEKILARSTEADLAYGNDGDDMRAPGKGNDPAINIYDLTSDQVQYAVARINLVEELMPELVTKYSKKGKSYQELLTAYMSLTSEYATQLSVISRQIGGVHINRAMVGQEGNPGPAFTPVALDKQLEAMSALKQYAFSKDAFASTVDVYNRLMVQRRGFNQNYGGIDPKIQGRILRMQGSVLNQLLHPYVLERITNSELYGNEYSLSTYMTDLTNSIFKADISGTVNATRQNLQTEYTNRLVSVIKSNKYDSMSQAMALYELNRIDQMANNSGGNTMSKAHKTQLRQIIKDAKEA